MSTLLLEKQKPFSTILKHTGHIFLMKLFSSPGSQNRAYMYILPNEGDLAKVEAEKERWQTLFTTTTGDSWMRH